jgi:hypothetical protein
MMRLFVSILSLLFLSPLAHAFFVPHTTEQRVAASSLIAVIEVTKVDAGKGVSEATVIQGLLGSKAKQKIEIWDDWRKDQEGHENRIYERDAVLEVGKRYLIYLTKNERGRLVTEQSFMDCLNIVGKNVQKEGEDGFEPLADKLAKIRTLIAGRKEAGR